MTRHIPIAEIAAALHRSDDFVKAITMLKAYFDDSGTHGESRITAIGGYVCSGKTWESVEREWLDVLEDYRSRYGVTWYHATDIARWTGEWGRVPLDACRDAPMRFAKVLGKHSLLPVWAAVKNEDFHKFATREFLVSFPTPFSLCFHQAMQQLYTFAQDNHNAMRIALFAAHGDYEERVNAAHRDYLRDGEFAEYIGPISFDEPRRVVPLQAADLLANQLYHCWTETEYPRSPFKYSEA